MSHVTGMHVQRNKAIVGQNAFAHEAGIHQDGMLKERTTYEIMRPEDVGLPRTELVLGKHSGRHALRQRISDLGYHLDDEQLQQVFEQFKVLADQKKEDLRRRHRGPGRGADPRRPGDLDAGGGHAATAARARSRRRRSCLWHQDGTHPPRRQPPATARSTPSSRPSSSITGIDVELRDFHVRSVTVGEDAQGEAQVEAEHNGRMLRGRAVSTDIIEASALAFLQVINRALLRSSSR